MSILGTVGGVVTTPFTVMGSATRHMMDSDVALGAPGRRWNEREEYRNTYTAPQRAGAGVGNVLGAAAPVVAIGAWAKYGWHVPGGFTPTPVGGRAAGTVAGAAAGAFVGDQLARSIGQDDHVGLATLVGAGVGGAAGFVGSGGGHGVQAVGVSVGAAMTAVGIKKAVQTVQDDGDLRSVGGVTGGLVAGAAGYKLGGKYGPLLGLGAGIAGAVGGYQAGKLVKTGAGHVGTGEHVANESVTHTEGVGRAQDFVRGAANHFLESGPITQGVSFGYTWKQQQHFQQDYSQPEQGGAIVGDLAAATVLGGGAVGLTRALTSKTGVAAGGVFAKTTFLSQAGTWITQAAIAQSKTGGGKTAMAVGALALAGGVAAWEGASAARGNGSLFSPVTDHVDAHSKTLGVSTRGLVAGGLTLAATAGVAALLHGRPVVQAMGGTKVAAGLGAAVLVSALSSARVPVQHVITDVKDLRAQRTQTDQGTTIAATGIGAAGGAAAGMAIGKAMKPGWGTAVGAGVGAVAGGFLGHGMSPALPGLGSVGLSAGVGAAALGITGLAFTHSAASAGKAAAIGGLLGTLASPVLTHGASAGTGQSVATPAGDGAGSGTTSTSDAGDTPVRR